MCLSYCFFVWVLLGIGMYGFDVGVVEIWSLEVFFEEKVVDGIRKVD